MKSTKPHQFTVKIRKRRRDGLRAQVKWGGILVHDAAPEHLRTLTGLCDAWNAAKFDPTDQLTLHRLQIAAIESTQTTVTA